MTGQEHDAPAGPPSSQGSSAAAKVLLVLGVLFVTTAIGVAISQHGKPAYSPINNLSNVLAPFMVIAVAIERWWESVFSAYENFALSVSRLIGVNAQLMGWMKQELKDATDALVKAQEALGVKGPQDQDYEELWRKFQRAEERLLDAHARVAEALKSPQYVSIKRAVTLFGSLMLGVLICVPAKLHILAEAGFNAPGLIDSVVTGLVVGAGPGPLHSLIGVLQELRNALAGVADAARGRAINPLPRVPPRVGQSPSNTPEIGARITAAESVSLSAERRLLRRMTWR